MISTIKNGINSIAISDQPSGIYCHSVPSGIQYYMRPVADQRNMLISHIISD